MNRLFRHVARNVVAYVALFVALGGTSYAAISLAPGSVGAAQIRNHVITPVKFDGRVINGSVRAWAVVGANGRLLGGGGGPHSTQSVTRADYDLSWGVNFHRACATVATIDASRSPATEHVSVPGNPSLAVPAGYAVASSFTGGSGRRNNVTTVLTFNQQGQLTPLAFDLAVIC
jgi:hypothetical protein